MTKPISLAVRYTMRGRLRQIHAVEQEATGRTEVLGELRRVGCEPAKSSRKGQGIGSSSILEKLRSSLCFLRGLLFFTESFRLSVAALLAWTTMMGSLHADGFVTRWREVREPFVITLLTAADVSSATATEMAVLVQRLNTGEIVPDATVELRFEPPAGAVVSAGDVLCGAGNELPPQWRNRLGGSPESVPALAEGTDNPLGYGIRIRLPSPGDWRVHLSVRHGASFVSGNSVVHVGGPAERLRSVWPSLALPPMAIVLFGINQALRRRRR